MRSALGFRARRLTATVVTLLLFSWVGRFVRIVYFPDLPAPQRADRTIDLNWSGSAEERNRYYHTSQGSLVIPYRWFLALEQFSIVPLLPKNWRRFRDPDHLARFRALPSEVTLANPDGLPVGLARTVLDDGNGDEYLGVTCSACHTGELHYNGVALRIDGGSTMLNLNLLLERMVLSLAVTISPVRPWKFRRFASSVLDGRDTPESRQRLREEVLTFLQSQFARGHLGELEGTLLSGAEFGRMDALATGGNRVFMQLSESNFEAPRAAVVAASLWGSYDYDWGLSNGAVRQPLARNVIQALAVNARVELGRRRRYASSVRLDNMVRMGEVVMELEPPRWPEEILGEIDRKRAARGRELFGKRCAGCHEPHVWTPASSPPDPVSTRFGRRFLQLKMVPLKKIGTDPQVALNFAARRVAGAAQLGLATGIDRRVPAGELTRAVVSGIMRRYWEERGLSSREQEEWGSWRADLWRAEEAYSSRPLVAVWATPPYLHNGSVPDLFQLLSPVTERDATFWLGTLDYDPERVGYRSDKLAGATRLDTRKPGNSNCGHEFRDPSTPPAEHCTDLRLDASGGKARLGPAFTDEERFAIIEYLKTIDTLLVDPGLDSLGPAAADPPGGEP